MKRIDMRIYLEDEAPRIGCGWRAVTIIIGRKWVRIIEKATGSRQRFKRADFAKIARGVV